MLNRICAATVVAAGVLLSSTVSAFAATSTIDGSIDPNVARIGAPFTLNVDFAIVAEEDDAPTLRALVLQFPDSARPNGAIFPACDAAAINARRGRFSACPAGSKIGSGRYVADVPNANVSDVAGRITFFNAGATRLTVHISMTDPVLVSEAFTATIRRTSGRFGYKVTAPVPETLQEISDGWFAVIKTVTATIGANRTIGGRRRGYLEFTTRCPRTRSVPLAGTFAFRAGTAAGPTSAESTIACRR